MSGYVVRLVAKSIRKNQKIAIVPTKKAPNLSTQRKEYINFNKQINNSIYELTNEVVSQLQSCAWDYPDHYINLVMTSPEGHETIYVIQEPETENTQTDDSSSSKALKTHQ